MIWCYGEVLWDCFEDRRSLGGAPLNVATHLRHWNFKTGFLSAVGQDALGQAVLKIIEPLGFENQLDCHPNLRTGTAMITQDGREVSFELDTQAAWSQISVADHISQADAIVFGSLSLVSNHNQTELLKLLQQTQCQNVFCDINLRSPHFNLETLGFCLRHCHWLKLNEEELFELKKQDLASGLNPDELVLNLLEKFKIKGILLTMGAQGMSLHFGGFKKVQPALSVPNFKDAVGAGDSVTATWVASVLKASPPELFLERAAIMGQLLCETEGAQPAQIPNWF
jgi:fructokinase